MIDPMTGCYYDCSMIGRYCFPGSTTSAQSHLTMSDSTIGYYRATGPNVRRSYYCLGSD